MRAVLVFRRLGDPFPILRSLVLRGAPVKAQDLGMTHISQARAAELLAWVQAELDTRSQFLAVVLGCGVHGNRSKLPPAQRSQLLKLRGCQNVRSRMRIAGFLGVRTSGVELERLRDAAAALATKRG